MDMTVWLEYFVEGLATQLREVQERGELVIRREVLAQKHALSERRRAALELALEHGGLTIHELRASVRRCQPTQPTAGPAGNGRDRTARPRRGYKPPLIPPEGSRLVNLRQTRDANWRHSCCDKL